MNAILNGKEHKQDYSIKYCKDTEHLVKSANKGMIGLNQLREQYRKTKILENERITVCVSITPETANFVLLLRDLGCDVQCCSDGLRSCSDPIAEYLRIQGIRVYAKSEETIEEHREFLQNALQFGNGLGPTYIIDDGCDITSFAIRDRTDLLHNLKGISEQTSSGIQDVYKLIEENLLNVPVIDVANSISKSRFDNLFGTRESLFSSIYNALNIQVSGKEILVIGYGHVGKGIASMFRSLGSQVYIADNDPINLGIAHFDGYQLTNLDKKLDFDLIVTATGNVNVIDIGHLLKLKNGVILCNAGHKNVEINMKALTSQHITAKTEINNHLTKYELDSGKEIYVLCNGHVINLVVGTGNSPIAMSVTFSNHLLALIELKQNPEKYNQPELYKFPKILDEKSILLNFPIVQDNLTLLSNEQKEYSGKNGNYVRRNANYYAY